MAYTPTNWACGDTITAEKLNKIEQGIALNGNTGIITLNIIGNDNTPPDYALQENWGDIASELLNSSNKHVYINGWYQANPGDPLIPSALGVPASYQYDGEDWVYIYASVPDGETNNLRCYNISGSYDAEYPIINVGDFQLTIA